VQGLYFCGASARPGNGVPLVLIGAQKTAEAILFDDAV
jgi:phytoene desaturase (3,4-didehydrolycopene-forming)